MAEEKVTMYYWPMLGRAGASVLMLEHKKQAYEMKSEFKDIASIGTAFGAQGKDTFAPPILAWGDVVVSQSAAVSLFVGNKLGIDKFEGNDRFKALKHTLDVADWATDVFNHMSKPAEDVKKFLSDRNKKWMTNVEAAIKGPYYFGSDVSSVDFFLYNAYKMSEVGMFAPVSKITGEDYTSSFKKVLKVVELVGALDGVKGYDKLPFLREGYGVKKEVLDALAKAK
eukprot:jgi/Bigna1/81139/fgenesh1_pg.77_\